MHTHTECVSMSSVLFNSSWHLSKEEVTVKMFSGSVIRSECLVGLDPEVVCDVRLKSRIVLV